MQNQLKFERKLKQCMDLLCWIICGFAIFCILINIVYTIVYSLKSDNSKTICFGDPIFTNIIGILVVL